MLNGEGKEMNRRIAKKLRKEMISWKSVDSPVRHCPSSFRKAWKIEMLDGQSRPYKPPKRHLKSQPIPNQPSNLKAARIASLVP